MSILMVDDHPDNLVLVKKLLEKAGFQDLQTAASAQEAFALLGASEKKLCPVDLILMDIMMPEIDGIEACRQIKELEEMKDILVIMMTALTDMRSLDAAFNAGAVDYVTKPLCSVELVARVRSALRLKHEMDKRKLREEELRVRNEELEKAAREIKTLRGFLPICMYCKKIRDDQGYWQQLEAYFTGHSDLSFSHGICEPCAKAHFPDYSPNKGKQNRA